MSIFKWFKAKNSILQDFLNGSDSTSGNSGRIVVTPELIMGIPAANRGVNLLADMVATLPLELYRKSGANIEKLEKDPQYQFVKYDASPDMPAQLFRDFITRKVILEGEAFAYRLVSGGNTLRYVTINDKVEVKIDKSGKKIFEVTDKNGSKKTYNTKQVKHFFRKTDDGLTGVGLVQEFQRAIELTAQIDASVSHSAKNNGRLSGILSKKDGPFKGEEQFKLFKDSFKKMEREGGTAVTDMDMEYKGLSMSLIDSQTLESRMFQVTEIARMLNIPAILLYHSDTAATFASSKELVQAFLKFSLDPWLVWWEDQYNREVTGSKVTGGDKYCKFSRKSLERMDLAARADIYSKLIASRVINPNEAREDEDLNPYNGGDEFVNPNTMTAKNNSDKEVI